ncbi:MAG: hypothetical protein LIP16_19025 [Clostridium sp.]|nr:hypothetical protein [Clostridium sp.]
MPNREYNGDNELRRTIKLFDPANWRPLNTGRRIDICQELENHLAKESGRAPYRIIRNSDNETYGSTVFSKKNIEINFDEGAYHCLASVVHESRHADQYHLMEKRLNANYNPNAAEAYKKSLEENGLSEDDVLIMNWETINYISGKKGTGSRQLYQMQLKEIDAEFESMKFLRKYSESMRENPEFMDFLQDGEDKLADLQNSFKTDETVNRWFNDRKQKVLTIDPLLFNREEQARLKAIYFSHNIEACNSTILTSFINWQKPERTGIRKVTLNELLGEKNKKPDCRQRPEAAPSKPAKEKEKSGCSIL